MEAVAVDLFVLNYNGAALLAECLPSILRAAAASRHRCRVVVLDNDSTDDSLALLKRDFPTVEVRRMPNRGLCSFNTALADYYVLGYYSSNQDSSRRTRVVEISVSRAGLRLEYLNRYTLRPGK